MDCIGYVKDGRVYDLQTAEVLGIKGECITPNDNDENALSILRHSTAHLMAQAIKELYPEAKFFVGPVIKEGFYYDFKVKSTISDADLKTIEKKMKQLASKKYQIKRIEISKDEFYEKFKDDELKQLVMQNITDEVITIYQQGEFEDLCKGPHLPNTKMIKNFKLLKVAGAYLGGDEKNEMINRIYGISFFEKENLKNYLNFLEEAKKRDHRKLGTELKLWNFSNDIGAGLPLWLPNGARLRAKLEKILYKAHRIRGYEPVRGPELLKAKAWKISGHYDNYKENMYFTEIDEGDEKETKIAEYGIKPMNCVGHIQIFKMGLVSYKELPLKFFEYGVVHRHEMSGALHGLLRVREFTQDDAHIFCTQEQIKDVIVEVMDFVDKVMKYFDFKYEVEISTKPDKAIGTQEFWDKTTNGLKDALNEMQISYGIDEGGGAFYGPKIDIKILDALNRKWQCGTIQVDMNLPERFELEYVDKDNSKQRPVMIHRAILGSFERFIGILTEHTYAEFPFAIAPTQVIIIPINETHTKYAQTLQKELLYNEIDAIVFNQNESLNKRIRIAEKQKVPFIVVIGDNEVKDESVALRDRRNRTQEVLSKNNFLDKVKKLREVEL